MGILAAGFLLGQQPVPAPENSQLPPEEDAAITAPKQYGFNPVQAKREVEVGRYYLKKGNFQGAASRFLEATRWNDGNADAWLLLAETEEKRENVKEARAAYLHYLELAPQARNAAEIKKKLEHLKQDK